MLKLLMLLIYLYRILYLNISMSSNKIVYQRNLSKVYALTLSFHTRSPLKVRHLESQGSGVEVTQSFYSQESGADPNRRARSLCSSESLGHDAPCSSFRAIRNMIALSYGDSRAAWLTQNSMLHMCGRSACLHAHLFQFSSLSLHIPVLLLL